ncbi:MAG TPA: SgcJ/EcaC family oxidoreductase [Candidatus Acidoferrales bacterium]|nr:SgcJ/EcaC family oxidoreductase [Candidatus Acidoferrales bacterium]
MRLRNIAPRVVALALLLTFTGCENAPKPEETKDLSARIAAVNALRSKYVAAFNANDAAAVAALYADDAIVMPANQAVVEGKPAIRSLYDAMFKANAVKISITPLETQVATDWAYDRGTATTTITPKSGKPIEESGKYLVIVKRQPGDMWQVYREIDNSNSPPPSAAPPGKKAAAKKAGKKGRK